ncbi:hypothetical protein FB45DRAFT_366525 [Roridomyces roridus]|uniref:Uncharacterized protein n=1 Tax=Roridomyces roridus TaxID=1738132 RepID=A0AAD7FX15_9AGAR|nr:hypothetical protein FB45DRAFT_366525 [Roridomyces roridus]
MTTMAPQAGEESNTGCGTTIHTGAMPTRDKRVWLASGEVVTRAVVLLPPEYFTERQQVRLDAIPRISECGCMTVGVGCGICGNALGSLTTRCEQHFTSGSLKYPTVYNFLPDSVSPPLPLAPRIKRVERASEILAAAASELPCPTEAAIRSPAPASSSASTTPRRRLSFTAIFADWDNVPRLPSPTPSERRAEYEAMQDQIDSEEAYEEQQRQAAIARLTNAQKEAPTTQEVLRKKMTRAVGVYAHLKRRKDGMSDFER